MIQKRTQNLGRGLEALLGAPPPGDDGLTGNSESSPLNREALPFAEQSTSLEREMLEQTTQPRQNPQIVMLRIDDIKTNPDQPRKIFSQAALEELAQSIRHFGILQPLIVFRDPNGMRYHLVAGERRLRAAQSAGLDTVPCVVRSRHEHSELELALIENIQRENLNVVEEALAYQKLIAEHSYTHEQLAEKMGKDRATITNVLRLLTLPAQILEDIQGERLTAGHAKVLCSLDDKKLQLRARDTIISKKLSVRQTEILVQSLRQPAQRRLKNDGFLSHDVRFLCDQLKGHLGTKVKIAGSETRGKIEISYFSKDDLDRVAELVLGNPLSLSQHTFPEQDAGAHEQ